MIIELAKGIGTGQTEISAFDAALKNAGVNNLNIIYLSSVIPPKATIECVESVEIDAQHYGKRVYVVMAREITSKAGAEAWAGLGWTQAKDMRGLFVEHHGSTEEMVEQSIDKSLDDLKNFRTNYQYGENHSSVVGIKCNKQGQYVCALVCAVYKIEDW